MLTDMELETPRKLLEYLAREVGANVNYESTYIA